MASYAAPDTPIPVAGPFLFMRSHRPDRVTLAAIRVGPEGFEAGEVRTPFGQFPGERLASRLGRDVVRYTFDVPATAEAWYEVGDERYPVNAAFEGDLAIAFASCNGQEHGDEAREEAERNLMWGRLGERHRARPFNLLLHGGDQIYADEVSLAHPASAEWPDEIPDVSGPEAEALAEALRDGFFRRYVDQFIHAEFAWVAARIPSLAIWDDHDICDGWGSLRARKLDSVVGRTIFDAARDMALIFQFGARPDEVPEIAIDRTGRSLGWAVDLPGLMVVAPDLRSERRPDRVMGEAGWSGLRACLGGVEGGKVLLVSSVPALGPRLSVVERLMSLTPWMEKYEDDLRDQWQSHAHREEWCDFLSELMRVHERDGASVTVLSGEIHLATRAHMETAAGALHQLVASGIAHPAPPAAYAKVLGALASFGEAPLPGHPIRIEPLPGQWARYIAERNFLVLTREGDAWEAVWDLEKSGPTPALPI
ncbi:alkaline phosphatase family protein [Acuticoccus sp. M5D2P5]|uniref:alkaline phosphatase D family protein n=1 Tax=Acuticoccus kalidii TaxID=2910977 RepID=UPI001F167A65|nr:alkaline phosphatase D family protein [Acuticoccus kalidii]MCF3935141.1 alkaline phosphatase family protein [Acuticoccus kalidii]